MTVIVNRLVHFALFPAVLLAGLLTAGTTHAADPSPLVGRVSYMDGTVSFHGAGETQWSYATVNYPVTSGLSFWTEPEARSEIEIGSSQLRMDSSTAIDVLQLTPGTRQIQIDQGTINYRVMHMDPGETIEVETPHGAVAIIAPGTYHIDAGDANNPTVVATLDGEARLIGLNSYLDVAAGEQASAIGDPLSYTMAQAQSTPFDDWALQRDQRERESETVKYVSPQTTGYQDLDQYGTWQPSPQYGQVWIPQNVSATWVPYREGHWVFVQPWGWTWIDDQPWGFAPFHYGRWAQVNDRWAWVPGTVVTHPVYAPALVAFTGGFRGNRSGIDVSLDIGGVGLSAAIGWLPLAPNEPYYPPYHTSRDYLRNVNYGTVNKTVINNITYNNQTRTVNNYINRPAATVVPTAAFTGARPVAASAVTPTQDAFRQAPINTNLGALKPSAFARAATAAPRAGAETAAPGPSAEAAAKEATQIRREEPNSLVVKDKNEESPIQAVAPHRAAPSAPNVQEDTARTAVHEAAPGPEISSQSQAKLADHGATEPKATTTERPEKPRAETAREPIVNHPHEGSTPGTAPGPFVVKSSVQNHIPLRQPAVEKATRQTEQASTQAPAREEKPRVPQTAYKPAAITKPVQAQPLKPTQAGWHRDEQKPQEEPKEKDHEKQQ